MSRRYPTAELYEERQRDFYRDGNRSERNYEELDIELTRGGNPRRSAPDFFREEYNRPTAGPLVVRERREEETTRGPPRRREVEEDTLVIRGGRAAPPPPSSVSSVRETERDDITVRRGEGRSRPREVEREETDITIRRRDSSRPARSEVREREVEHDEIVFRRGDGARPRPREVEFEREEVRFQERAPPPRPRSVVDDREEIIFRHDHRESSRHGREREVEKDSLVIRGRERSLPPPRPRGELVAREREEFTIRRREDSPPPRRDIIKDEIIIRRREERSPSPPPPPPPPPEPEPIVRPPIIQEVITHHRHIDHGVERARSPTPPPPPPSPPREDTLEIAIKRRESRGGRGFEEDIFFERETVDRKSRDLDISSRSRSLSVGPPKRAFTAPVNHDSEFEFEADYYNRKALERGHPGEAINGATKDWGLVDVPPGTNKVRMEGIGGGAQEITWQRYNGIRRSKFLSGDDEAATDFGIPGPKPKAKDKDMWTEVTKDLVIKEAIDRCGYDYEETEGYYYVMEYLRYEDVLQLVEISDDIRRERRSRIREIEFEREKIRDRRPEYDERVYEHEVSYDRHRRRYR
ncbi:hypothetical protein BDV96DRAFT_647576 [Lophiotrema nucula]|uniref:DUF8035 domain-containing protein n=1 Tax=Lophiotrema nucula TaxID=690887 RepID=A0A6A5Z3U8_9PLEO|nr:hypothetical protein BDV96DRAFT_647576 [Lophiotrema nucula]